MEAPASSTAIARPTRIAGVLLALSLAGCGLMGDRGAPRDLNAIPDARPRVEPRSAFGNPPSYEVNGRRYYTLPNSRDFVDRGVASWYGPDFHGKPTSSREVYDMYGMTAAHPTLPLPTYVMVTNLENGRRVVVRVNDRGPFHDDRVIDLSYTAAWKLGIVPKGTGLVELRAIDPEQPSDLRLAAGPLPPPGRKPDIYVQVGAFGSRDNAARLQTRLSSAAPTAVRVSETNVQNRPLYRVRLGPVGDVEEADRLVAMLTGLGIQDHHVVVE
jgi:rare lipoprotein A